MSPEAHDVTFPFYVEIDEIYNLACPASPVHHQRVLKDIAALAARYDVAVRSTTRSKVAPDEAILREAKRGYDLIVLGVSRRPGEALYFGNTATSILDHSSTSNLFVAS